MCGNDEVQLVVENKNCFSTYLEVTYKQCYLKDDVLRKDIEIERRKRSSVNRTTSKNRKKVSTLSSRISKLNKKRSDLLEKVDNIKTNPSISLTRYKKLGFLDLD